jgi:putative DNA primase/helicase
MTSLRPINGPEDLYLVGKVERFAPTDDVKPKPRLKVYGLHEFTQLELPERQNVLSPIIPEKGLVMVYAKRGVGKTHAALGIAFAVATGGTFLNWQAPQSRNVLYVDGEMPGRLLQERIDAILAGADQIPPDWNRSFKMLSMDMQEIGLTLNLANPEDQKWLDDYLDGVELLVLDNLSTLVQGGRENDAESWDAMQAWLVQLRRRGISVLLIHHAGRSDNARGTSKREDVLDTVIHLKQPEDYRPEDGARFEVHLTKARSVYGEDANPFEARMSVQNDAVVWSVQDIRDLEAEQVAELTRQEHSVREIAEMTGLSKSKVNRIQKSLRTGSG